MAVGETIGRTDSPSYQVPGILQETGWEILTFSKYARPGGGREGRPLEKPKGRECIPRRRELE